MFFLILFSCKKEDVVSDIPEIEFISISPIIVQEYLDEVTIAISYIDANGDLGENNPDIYNLFVKDNRNNIVYKYRIPELAPSGNNISIQGNFDIIINGTGITNESTSEKVTYEIYVVDKSKNESNTITTSEITVHQ